MQINCIVNSVSKLKNCKQLGDLDASLGKSVKCHVSTSFLRQERESQFWLSSVKIPSYTWN